MAQLRGIPVGHRRVFVDPRCPVSTSIIDLAQSCDTQCRAGHTNLWLAWPLSPNDGDISP
jgi:hypothetical protein